MPDPKPSSEMPGKVPAKAPVKAAGKTPAKTPAKAPAKTPGKTPVKAAAKTPAKTPAKAPPKTATKAPARMARAKPAGAPGKVTSKRADRARAAASGGGDGTLSAGLFKGGERSGDVLLAKSVFGETPHQAVMHQAFLRQLANARQGSASTKTRGLVAGGGAKPYRQKGTGRARHGSTREPSMVGGGTVFGPRPRSFAQRMPRKMRRLALRSALSVKAREEKVKVVESFELDQPRTRLMAALLRSVGVEHSCLVVLPAPNWDVSRTIANLPWAKTVLAHNLSLYDLFTHEHLVIARDALELLEENFGQ
ncbi:MAG: 50S ribosomal protein L4 [Candidatus Dormibacteraceae bacterium]